VSESIPSLHVIGSKAMGGAERWFVRFLRAMQAQGEPVQAIVRRDSALAGISLGEVSTALAAMRTVWDPWSKIDLARLVQASGAPVVQTYMGRATRLLRLPAQRGRIHVARLGGYYKVQPFRNAHAWIGNTRGLCDWLVSQGLPADRVHHIYNFADPARPVRDDELAACRRAVGASPEDVLLVTAGRLIDVKGHRFVLDAMTRLPRAIDGRRPRLLVLGDGPLLPALLEQARQTGIAERVTWLGWQDDPAPWFALADMVVFPSREAETLGNVILEAWAHGKPLVTAAFRGAREIARHGEDAWVVPCDDGPALAQGIAAVLANAALARALARAGRTRVATDFGETAIIGQYRALYAHLADHG